MNCWGFEISIGASYLAISELAFVALCCVMAVGIVAWFMTVREEE